MKKYLVAILVLLFAFTGIKISFSETEKEEIKPPKTGFVTLSKEEYKKLLEMLKPDKDSEIKPPTNTVIKSAYYDLKITPELRVEGTVTYELESLEDEKWIEARLQMQSAGISMNTPPDGLMLKNKGSDIYYGTNRKGKYTVSGEVNIDLIKGDINRYAFNFYTSNAVINLVKLSYKPAELKIISFPNIQISSKKKDSIETVEGLLLQNNYTNFSLEKQAARDEDEGKKRVEVDSKSSFVIEKNYIRASYHYEYSVNRGGLNNPVFLVPEETEIISVNGSSILNWEEKESSSGKILEVSLKNLDIKTSDIYITAEKQYNLDAGKLELPFILMKGADRFSNLTSISVNEEMEATTEDLKNVDEIDIANLPSQFFNQGALKPVLAYKFSWDGKEDKPEAVLGVKKYEQAAVLTANIENAEITTLYTKNGKSLVRMKLWIRNNIKQNLKIWAPQNFKLWSCFMDANPVKPTTDNDGGLLIPLKQSEISTSSVFFPLEIFFYHEGIKMDEEGTLSFNIPRVDLQIMKLGWELLLPLNYEYEDWAGNLTQSAKNEFSDFAYPKTASNERTEQKMQIQSQNAVNVFMANDAQYQNITKQTNELIQNFQQKDSFSKVKAGRLPVKFSIPRVGQQFLFTKLLVLDQDLKLNVEYEEE
ncbi:MAG: hypothetical protein JW737_04425 [Acidobacteria bacterium]|nr:hypothetical protein [Acidobacteriota bacterium]